MNSQSFRLLHLLSLLFLATGAVRPQFSAQAAEFSYTTNNGTLTITGGCPRTAGAVIIPPTLNGLPVTSIGDEAFYGCSSLTDVVIPDSVTSIGDRAFQGCTGLTNVTIPDSVTRIGDWAFLGCTGLTNVTIPNSVTRIGEGAFAGCTGLTNVTIPNSVTSIGDEAFYGCSSLTDVVIPNSVTSIGEEAFAGCTGLTNVTIPDSVTSIGDWAFGGCTGLTRVTIPDSVTSIGGGAFNGCTGLTNVTIPNNFTRIWDWAYSGCTGLTSVTIPDSVTSIGGGAFSGCTGLTNVTIPNSVTSIGDRAFLGCTGLTSVVIPHSVTSIGEGAFYGCTGLTSVVIPDSVTRIGDWVFVSCTGLTNVTIPNSVTSIGKMALAGCTSLTSITIPDRVTRIGDDAFWGCTSLREVYFQGDAPTLGVSVFRGSPAAVYYLAGTAGWERLFGNHPTIRMGPPELEVGLYAGLSITGAVGTVYSVEYLTDLAQTNTPSAWRCLEYLQLPASPYLWADKSAPAPANRFFRAVVFPAPTNMGFIPPGTFMMGSPPDEVDRIDEGPQTAVTISRGYWMGKYEVTQGEYLALMGSNPSRFSTNNGFADGLSRPVENVSWDDATAYCSALTQREVAAGRIGTNSVYRLPTEAEWEYACRGWTSTRFSYGDDPGYTNLTNYAWYGDNSDGQTHAVGQKLPNPWGLYDMHGNVWEWCQDWRSDYTGGLAVDPLGPASGSDHVIRGGGWRYGEVWGFASFCRTASRLFDSPDGRRDSIGFRVVLAPGQP